MGVMSSILMLVFKNSVVCDVKVRTIIYIANDLSDVLGIIN